MANASIRPEWYSRRESWKQQSDDARQAGDVDYARLIHSASFRRLQGKTQILNLGDSDFYRTRLTHSLEVAQIAEAIARQLKKHSSGHDGCAYLPEPSLIRAVGHAHDLGHPPFGHGGEAALNYCMRDNGGFEGNGQTLRLLSKLEKFSDTAGANLCRRTLLGVLKYPIPYSKAFNPERPPRLDDRPSSIKIIDRKASKPPKCYMDSEQDIVDWILDPLNSSDRTLFCARKENAGKHHEAIHKSLDCSIMELADDISFGVHDLEDALALKLITEDDFRKFVPEEACSGYLTALKEKYKDEFGNNVYDQWVSCLFGEGRKRKRNIGRLVYHFVTNCNFETVDGFEEPLLQYRVVQPITAKLFLKGLKDLVREVVIFSASVQHLEFKGQWMVVSVFEVLHSDPQKFLPRDTLQLFNERDQSIRVICDHIAGMTDNFLLKTYDRLFSPHMGSVFDKL